MSSPVHHRGKAAVPVVHLASYYRVCFLSHTTDVQAVLVQRLDTYLSSLLLCFRVSHERQPDCDVYRQHLELLGAALREVRITSALWWHAGRPGPKCAS
jgi:hypothetical protein